jgi:L-seryl-tRNA(Ser) seleniumtransferase
VVASEALVGAGSAPGTVIASVAVALDGDHGGGLRRHDPPIIGRVDDGRTLLDLRSCPPEHDATLTAGVRSLRR